MRTDFELLCLNVHRWYTGPRYWEKWAFTTWFLQGKDEWILGYWAARIASGFTPKKVYRF